MAKLTDILRDYARIMYDLDAADGEIDADIAVELNACEEDLREKTERIEHLVEALKAKASSVKERAKALQAHAQALEVKAARVHDWVIGELERAGLAEYETDSFSLKRRASPPRLEVTDEEALRRWLQAEHPDLVAIEYRIDKREVFAMAKLTLDGKLTGAEIARGHHWRVS
jgi:phage host-nuclease inhibitor protein Gam